MTYANNITLSIKFAASLTLSYIGTSAAVLLSIPETIMQAFQILSWSGSAALGLITLYKFIKSKKK